MTPSFWALCSAYLPRRVLSLSSFFFATHRCLPHAFCAPLLPRACRSLPLFCEALFLFGVFLSSALPPHASYLFAFFLLTAFFQRQHTLLAFRPLLFAFFFSRFFLWPSVNVCERPPFCAFLSALRLITSSLYLQGPLLFAFFLLEPLSFLLTPAPLRHHICGSGHLVAWHIRASGSRGAPCWRAVVTTSGCACSHAVAPPPLAPAHFWVLAPPYSSRVPFWYKHRSIFGWHGTCFFPRPHIPLPGPLAASYCSFIPRTPQPLPCPPARTLHLPLHSVLCVCPLAGLALRSVASFAPFRQPGFFAFSSLHAHTLRRRL